MPKPESFAAFKYCGEERGKEGGRGRGRGRERKRWDVRKRN